MTNLVFVRNGQALTTSKTIAAGVDIQHQNILALCRQYQADFEAFGIFTFETWKLSDGRGRPETIALLNEQQATLLVTYCRNTEKVRAFKVALVKAFYEARGGAQKLTIEQCKILLSAIGKRARTPDDYRRIYNALHTRFNVRSYVEIPFDRFDDALAIAAGIPLAPVESEDFRRYERLGRSVMNRSNGLKQKAERAEQLLRAAIQEVRSIRENEEAQYLVGSALTR